MEVNRYKGRAVDETGTESKEKRSRMQEGGGNEANETERVLGWAAG